MVTKLRHRLSRAVNLIFRRKVHERSDRREGYGLLLAAFNMKKIRINELARELEVKPSKILDMLPGLGVQEKKTHSSSIDEDVAIQLRKHFGFDGPPLAGHIEDDSEVYDERPFEPAS